MTTANNNNLQFFIETFGCQMNEADSGKLRVLLSRKGFNPAGNYKDADIIIMNTCSVRKKAEETAYQHLNNFRSHKKNNPGKIIAFGGCIGQEKSKELLKKFPGLDLVFGTETLLKIPSLLEDIIKKRKRVYDTEWDVENKIINENIPWLKNGKITGFIPISRGCSNYCSYCIVPFTRGAEKNRPFGSVMKEAGDAVKNGIKEITLLGQNVNSYYDNGKKFRDLLEELNKIEGLKRIRFLTSHPRDLSEGDIQTINECSKVCEHYHLPLQSASDRVLKLMNRGYTIAEYDKKIDYIRKLRPYASVTTDIIIGFPGETEKDFEDTLNYMRKTEFDSAFSFMYSKRPNTKALELEDSITETVKKKRLKDIIDMQENISRRVNEKLLNKITSVLIEGVCKNEKQKLFGKTRTGKPVVFSGNGGLIGQEVAIKIVKTGPHTLAGEIV
ncbi:MAG: tRNA (N6-isopentenyl adenosine(37)-C2)-methylthiotransferase MiaB [bacterium]